MRLWSIVGVAQSVRVLRAAMLRGTALALVSLTVSGAIGPARAEVLTYVYGDTVDDGIFDPRTGPWSGPDSWWQAGGSAPGPRVFDSGDTAVFRQDLSLTTVSVDVPTTLAVSGIRFEAGSFRLVGTASRITGVASGSTPRPQIHVAAGAQGRIEPELGGAFDVIVDGRLTLTTQGSAIQRAQVGSAGVLVFGRGSGSSVEIAGETDNAGLLRITDGMRLGVAGPLVNAAGATLAAGTGGGTLETAGLLDNAGLIDGRTGAFAIRAGRLVLQTGSRIAGDVTLSAAKTENASDFDFRNMPVLGGDFVNQAGGRAVVGLTLDGAGHDLVNEGTFDIRPGATVGSIGSLTNRGALTLGVGSTLTATRLRHLGGALVSSGEITGAVDLQADAALSGRINGRLAVLGGVTQLTGNLVVSDGTAAPDVQVTAGELNFGPGRSLDADMLRAAGRVDFGSGGRVIGSMSSIGVIAGDGIVDGDLSLEGGATLDSGARVSVGGRLINRRSAATSLVDLAGLRTGLIENHGQLAIDSAFGGDVINETDGTMAVTERIDGLLDSRGQTRLGGTGGTGGGALVIGGGLAVGGGVTRIAGDTEVRDPGALPGRVTTAAGGALVVEAGKLTAAGGVDSRGSVTIAEGARLETPQLALFAGEGVIGGVLTGAASIGPAAGLVLDGGRIEGALRNQGRMTSAASAGTGSVELASGMENAAGAVAEIGTTGRLAAVTGAVANRGALTLRANTRGDVENTAGAELTMTGGKLTGNLLNSGRANVNTQVTGVIDNSGTLAAAGQAGTLRNGGRLSVEAGERFQTSGGTVNAAGGTVVVAGTLGGLLTNQAGGSLTLSGGRLADGLTNHGRARLSGRVEAGGVINMAGAEATIAGSMTGAIDNRAGAVLTGGGEINGTVQNAGTMDLASDLTVNGDVVNRGRITQRVNDTILDVNGILRQSGNIDTGGFKSMTIKAERLDYSGTGSVGAGVRLMTDLLVRGALTMDKDNSLYGDVAVDAAGKLTIAAAIDGQGTAGLSNAGATRITGRGKLTGMTTVSNRSSLSVESGGDVAGGRITNLAGGVLVNRGTLRGAVSNGLRGTLVSSGTLTNDLVNAGDAVLSGRLGALTNSGKVTINAGTTLTAKGAMLNSGDFVSRGRVAGLLDNRGRATLSGRFDDRISNTGTIRIDDNFTGGAIDNGGALSVAAGTTTKIARGLVIRDRGRVVQDGNVVGFAVNRGSYRLSGTFDGDFSNEAGDLITGADATITGKLESGSTLPVAPITTSAAGTPAGVLVGSSVIDSRLIVGAGSRLTVRGGTVNGGSSHAQIGGRLVSDLTNIGRLDLTGTIAGSVENRGTAQLSGAITGDLTHRAGTLSFARRMNVGGRVTLSQDASVARGSEVEARAIRVNGGATLALAGRLGGSVSNSGVIQVEDGAVAAGRIRNLAGGTLTVDGAGATGTLRNDGLIEMRNRRVGDRLTARGGLSGTGHYGLDLDLDKSNGTQGSDVIEVKGGAITGKVLLDFDIREKPRGSDFSTRIVLIDADARYATANSYAYEARNLPAANEKVVYGLGKDRSGSLVMTIRPNASIGGLIGNIVLTQSLIGSVVNRPTSPYVTGYAPAEGESPCAPGAWARATGGRAEATGSSATTSFSVNSTISASYRGMQFGGDMACFDGRFRGWNMAVGILGGVNDGTTTQPVQLLDFIDGRWVQSDRVGSINNADFRQIYGGVYATAVRDRLSADLQVRRESTEFEVSNKPLLANSVGLGLTKGKFGSRATTISGSLSYALALPQKGWQLVPTAGFAFSKTSTDPISFDDGTRLIIEDSSSRVGFAGVTLARGTVLPSGTEALNYYATGTIYREFAGGTRSAFVTYNADGSVRQREELVSDNLGTYGELSLGVNYTRVLQPGRTGKPRQFSASLRLDGRRGNSLDSHGITAQMRWQF